MGGNAIENACRISKQEFEEVSRKIINKINELDPSFHPRIIPYFKDKQDFGDIDILVSSDAKKIKLNIANALHSVGKTYSNGNVLSLGYQLKDNRVFQVDLISVPYIDLDIAEFYFSYNDLNLLTGRIAHKLGVKFGFDGLVLKIRTESGHGGLDINLTKDPRRIYEFLGYDYDRYLQGFNNLEEIYQFVSSTKYFNPAVFDYEDLNHINKTRNRKRATYRGFLEYAHALESPSRYEFQQKSVYLIKLHCEFPEADIFGQMKEYSERYRVSLEANKKFNGNLVMEWTSLRGKELGAVLAGFKSFVRVLHYMEFDKYIANRSPEAVKERFLYYYDNFYKENILPNGTI